MPFFVLQKTRAELLENWLVLTSVKYHDNHDLDAT